MSEEETPLGIGAVYGLRAWLATAEGRLFPIVHHEMGPWVDGRNTAACARLEKLRTQKPTKPDHPTSPELLTPLERHRRLIEMGALRPLVSTTRLKVVERGDEFPRAEDGDPVYPELESIPLADQYRLLEHDYLQRMAIHPLVMQRYRQQLDCQQAEYEASIVDHQSPVEDCDCGIYLAKTLAPVEVYRQNDALVLGVVKGHGRTASYAKGWRVQHAEIVAAAVWNDTPLWGMSDEKRYSMSIMRDHQMGARVLPSLVGANMRPVWKTYPSVRWYQSSLDLLEEWAVRIGDA